MPRIQIANLAGMILEANDTQKTILQHVHDHRLDWMHACGGKGRCTTCKIEVISGLGNLNAPTIAEQRYRNQRALAENERLSCQAKASSDIVIRVPDECKLPHISYSD